MKSNNVTYFVYGALAAVLLICMFNLPDWALSLLRFATTCAFGYFAYKAGKEKKWWRMILFIALAVLFQPIVKIPLGKVVWSILEVVVAIYLIVLLVRLIKNKCK